jgi:predicted phosphodiesterase
MWGGGFVRALIISDLHGNIEAVNALPRGFDQIWVLGDLVNYGPNPAEVIEFVRNNAAIVVRGNHDHSIGFDQDPQCSARFRAMAEETGRFTRSVVRAADRSYLRGLPLTATITVDQIQVAMCHAAPSDPLFEYRPENSPRWEADQITPGVDVELLGHTHVPFQRRVGNRRIVSRQCRSTETRMRRSPFCDLGGRDDYAGLRSARRRAHY